MAKTIEGCIHGLPFVCESGLAHGDEKIGQA
jgi:hypothetical protein